MTTIKEFIQEYTGGFRNLNQSAKYFLLATLLFGIFISGWSLFFNFYLLQSGFDREFLGLAQSLPSIAIFLFSLPFSIWVDRMGRKRAMLIGQTVFMLGYIMILMTNSGWLILLAGFIAGAGNALFIVSELPLLVRLSSKENRSFLFSLNFAVMTFSGVLGNYLAGQLPGLYENLFGVAAGTALSYQYAMRTSLLMLIVSYIPLLLLKIPPKPASEEEMGSSLPEQIKELQNILHDKIVMQLAAPNLLIGIGAALLIPYLNIFLAERFHFSDNRLGMIFSMAALITGFGSLLAPRLERRAGTRIRAVVLTQTSSLLFLLLLGFSPLMGLALLGFFARGMLMNIGVPLYDSFAMEQVPEHRQATLSSLKELAWQFGWALGPYFSGLVQQAYGFGPLFILTGVMYGIAISVTWRMFGAVEATPPAQVSVQTVQ